MFTKLDEEHYVENPFLAHLQRLGWKFYRQNKDNPEDIREILSFSSTGEPILGEIKKFRESFREVVLESELKEAIKKINNWIEEDQINQVIEKLTRPQSRTPLEVNREIHDLLLEGTSVSENRKTGDRSPTAWFLDFKNSENNSFTAISQFKVNIPGTEKHIIPDIVLFVNGLPLVVIECKSPAISDPIGEAITQIMRYSNRRGVNEGNERLFWYNLFSVATSKQIAKYGTITSGYEHFVEWKDPYPYSLSDISSEGSISSQQVLCQGMLSKNTLLALLHSYTIFKEDSKGGFIKVVARYQQFRAVKKLIKRLKEGKTPEEKGGIIWHTQGSGKSLTMMFAVRELYHDPEFQSYKIVFITDRKALHSQLKETSKSVGFTVHPAESIKELQELLRTDTPDLVMAMVHKFQERELKTDFPVLNTSPKILIMIDEAHRTQYKLLGANLRKSLPNSVKIAFTGTPIEKTEMTFGDYIDKYGIKQAVEDGVTVDIVYEGRAHEAEIRDETELDKKFLDIFTFADNEQRKILGKFTWKAYLEHEGVIRHKAKDMIEHYVTHVFPNGFKAQVVTASRLAAIRYKNALEEAIRDKINELKTKDKTGVDTSLLERLKVAVVISGAPNDPPEYATYTDPVEHERVIASFNMPFQSANERGITGDVGILVVQSMLITGFDAPIEQVMYLDNVIKEHNLLQAIARVNRVYRNKSCGFVVDYVGVLKHLKEALSIYADKDIEEIMEIVKDKAKSIDELRYIYNLIMDFFKKYQIENWREEIDECIDLLVDEEVRDEFITLMRKFNRAMDAVLPDPEALKYVKDLKILNFIKESARQRYRDEKLSIKEASRKIREIVEEYLISKGIDPKIPPIPLLDEGFLVKLKREKSDKAKAEELKNAIIEHIEKHFEEDPELYERFSDRLKKMLEEYKEKWDILAAELENLREEIRKGRESEKNFGFEPKKEMPFLGLLKRELFGKEPIEKLNESQIEFLTGLTQDVLSIIREEIKQVDFWESYPKQKRLKSYLISHFIGKISSFSDYDSSENSLFKKRNEIAQKLIELAYHIYGK
ncbi:type I restriction endonuclease subunit R [Thermodesulfovibrio thiophilus]|uniref:type I restriction endonuclease subunit R n=1 Tax=Thermodesulfovibrio thiophilus TaxID=340095 RepID=UPI00040A2A3C|nr:type I restriction endonuclease subunit R [Thermodesulfovibrio thiophilus]